MINLHQLFRVFSRVSTSPEYCPSPALSSALPTGSRSRSSSVVFSSRTSKNIHCSVRKYSGSSSSCINVQCAAIKLDSPGSAGTIAADNKTQRTIGNNICSVTEYETQHQKNEQHQQQTESATEEKFQQASFSSDSTLRAASVSTTAAAVAAVESAESTFTIPLAKRAISFKRQSVELLPDTNCCSQELDSLTLGSRGREHSSGRTSNCTSAVYQATSSTSAIRGVDASTNSILVCRPSSQKCNSKTVKAINGSSSSSNSVGCHSFLVSNSLKTVNVGEALLRFTVAEEKRIEEESAPQSSNTVHEQQQRSNSPTQYSWLSQKQKQLLFMTAVAEQSLLSQVASSACGGSSHMMERRQLKGSHIGASAGSSAACVSAGNDQRKVSLTCDEDAAAAVRPNAMQKQQLLICCRVGDDSTGSSTAEGSPSAGAECPAVCCAMAQWKNIENNGCRESSSVGDTIAVGAACAEANAATAGAVKAAAAVENLRTDSISTEKVMHSEERETQKQQSGALLVADIPAPQSVKDEDSSSNFDEIASSLHCLNGASCKEGPSLTRVTTTSTSSFTASEGSLLEGLSHSYGMQEKADTYCKTEQHLETVVIHGDVLQCKTTASPKRLKETETSSSVEEPHKMQVISPILGGQARDQTEFLFEKTRDSKFSQQLPDSFWPVAQSLLLQTALADARESCISSVTGRHLWQQVQQQRKFTSSGDLTSPQQRPVYDTHDASDNRKEESHKNVVSTHQLSGEITSNVALKEQLSKEKTCTQQWNTASIGEKHTSTISVKHSGKQQKLLKNDSPFVKNFISGLKGPKMAAKQEEKSAGSIEFLKAASAASTAEGAFTSGAVVALDERLLALTPLNLQPLAATAAALCADLSSSKVLQQDEQQQQTKFLLNNILHSTRNFSDPRSCAAPDENLLTSRFATDADKGTAAVTAAVTNAFLSSLSPSPAGAETAATRLLSLLPPQTLQPTKAGCFPLWPSLLFREAIDEGIKTTPEAGAAAMHVPPVVPTELCQGARNTCSAEQLFALLTRESTLLTSVGKEHSTKAMREEKVGVRPHLTVTQQLQFQQQQAALAAATALAAAAARLGNAAALQSHKNCVGNGMVGEPLSKPSPSEILQSTDAVFPFSPLNFVKLADISKQVSATTIAQAALMSALKSSVDKEDLSATMSPLLPQLGCTPLTAAASIMLSSGASSPASTSSAAPSAVVSGSLRCCTSPISSSTVPASAFSSPSPTPLIRPVTTPQCSGALCTPLPLMSAAPAAAAIPAATPQQLPGCASVAAAATVSNVSAAAAAAANLLHSSTASQRGLRPPPYYGACVDDDAAAADSCLSGWTAQQMLLQLNLQHLEQHMRQHQQRQQQRQTSSLGFSPLLLSPLNSASTSAAAASAGVNYGFNYLNLQQPAATAAALVDAAVRSKGAPAEMPAVEAAAAVQDSSISAMLASATAAREAEARLLAAAMLAKSHSSNSIIADGRSSYFPSSCLNGKANAVENGEAPEAAASTGRGRRRKFSGDNKMRRQQNGNSSARGTNFVDSRPRTKIRKGLKASIKAAVADVAVSQTEVLGDCSSQFTSGEVEREDKARETQQHLLLQLQQNHILPTYQTLINSRNEKVKGEKPITSISVSKNRPPVSAGCDVSSEQEFCPLDFAATSARQTAAPAIKDSETGAYNSKTVSLPLPSPCDGSINSSLRSPLNSTFFKCSIQEDTTRNATVAAMLHLETLQQLQHQLQNQGLCSRETALFTQFSCSSLQRGSCSSSINGIVVDTNSEPTSQQQLLQQHRAGCSVPCKKTKAKTDCINSAEQVGVGVGTSGARAARGPAAVFSCSGTRTHRQHTQHHPGVCYSPPKDVWRARITVEGRQHEQQFSVKRHGFEEARLLAVQWRAQMENLRLCGVTVADGDVQLAKNGGSVRAQHCSKRGAEDITDAIAVSGDSSGKSSAGFGVTEAAGGRKTCALNSSILASAGHGDAITALL